MRFICPLISKQGRSGVVAAVSGQVSSVPTMAAAAAAVSGQVSSVPTMAATWDFARLRSL